MMLLAYILTTIGALAGIFLLLNTLFPREDTMLGKPGKAFFVTSLDELTTQMFHPAQETHATLFIFSADCPHCAEIVAQWNTLTNDLYTGNILGLSLSSAEATARFMLDNKTRFRVQLIGSEVLEGYQIEGTPTTIHLHNGIVEMMVAGPLDDEAMEYLSNIHKRGIR